MTEQRAEPRYRLDSRIATGGMGEVWRATDTVLDREVAVKVLKHEYADDPTFRSRLAAEARHAAALHHHNVASVFDFGELEPEDGSGMPRPYIVMELVPGQPLSALLRDDEPMPPETAADLMAQAADALASAHALGIVHRDVKPANLLVTPQGQIKITDFGIARAADGAALTMTGQVIGTPAYISPEQAEGHSATKSSDIYSLGVVLYECLAGRRPFQGDTPVSTALAHLRSEPDPLPDRVPAHLRAIVAAALAKDPAERFPSMSEFAAALRGSSSALRAAGAAAAASAADAADQADSTRVLTGIAPVPPAAAPGSDPSHRRRGLPPWWPWAASALGVLLIVISMALVAARDNDDAAATTPEVPAESAEPKAEEPTEEPAPEEPEIRLDRDDYIGRDADEVEDELKELDLKVKQEKIDNLESAPEGTVADIDPTGRVEPEDEITLWVWDKPLEEEVLEPPGKSKGKDKDNGKGNTEEEDD